MESYLFTSWGVLLRLLVVGTACYISMVGLLRLAGKQSLAKRNAYGLVVTVALGSTLSTAVLSKDASLAEIVGALVLLLGLQLVRSLLTVHSARMERLATSQPGVVLWRGELLRDRLREERLTEAEVRAAVRQAGQGELEKIDAVVLEVDGSLSVIPRVEGSASALSDVYGRP